MSEKMIDVGGVELCTEPFGAPGDPPILLVAGIGSSMLGWDEGFCRLLADRGRFVVRYDHRDTGRSVAYEPGHPGYGGVDLVSDIGRVLDGYGLAAAHLAGISAGGGCGQELALDHPDRVLSLTLISTSPAVSVGRALPGPTGAFGRFLAQAEVDWSSTASVVEYLVGYLRVLAGEERPFDEAEATALVEAEIDRARNFASVQNHDLVAGDGGSSAPLASLAAPTLVIHGTADPMFPLEHGQALADEIPGATLLPLDGAGHGLYRTDWPTVVPAIADLTASR
jgi:pimeloyl-ACP methyl ester carboxylesterase